MFQNLTELFNLSFPWGVFSLILKTSKVVPVYKKTSELKCFNNRLLWSIWLSTWKTQLQSPIYFFRNK